MKQLQPNWITEGLIDFEYKKYLLLAYLKEVSKHFDECRLYPFLSDLLAHYNNLITIKQNKTYVSKQFPRQISRVDLENFTVEYERMIVDDACMEEVEAILDYAIPRMYQSLMEGRELYHDVEQHLQIYPVGIVSLNPETGLMLLVLPNTRDTQVYRYQITVFESSEEQFRGIRTAFVGEYRQSFTNTLEAIKLQVLNQLGAESHPAAYAVEVMASYPLQETLLPVARRSLVRYICTHHPGATV
ncbi:MAG: hypothetical protein RMK52_00830 [Chitinophagales bacterium]|nr:hypothetical protein [Chitinophagales bacterium]MDW8392769.1 hypothetical protein [Chitinophagales bacterium]